MDGDTTGRIPSSRYTVVVETGSTNLFGDACFVTRHAQDFDDYSAANEYAHECRVKWLDPTTRVRIIENGVEE